MYKVLVRSHLDYCDIIYHEPSQQNQPPLCVTLMSLLMEKVERIQYQAALAVTGAWQGSNRSKLYEESYLKDKLPPFHRPYLFSENFSNYSRELRCRSLRYMNSFFPDAFASWNIIIKDFDTVPSFEILKGHIISIIRPKTKSIFGIHDPLGLRYLFQLRYESKSFAKSQNAS